MHEDYPRLRARLAEIEDLRRSVSLLFWDQQTKMPPAAAGVRAEQIATLSRMAHELFVADETHRLLERLGPWADGLDPGSDEASLVRVARRDYEKSVCVPADLRAEMSRAASQGHQAWMEAKHASDFARFLPTLERNVELKHRYVDCHPPAAERYDVLLDDYEPEMLTAEVREVFGRLRDELVPLIAELAGRDDPSLAAVLEGDYPLDEQRRISHEVLELWGFRPDTWRLDRTEHPFASGTSVDDIRLTTHYHEGNLESLFATMHEYGHGLYEHGVDPALDRSPLGSGVSLGMHESQSRMWENLVGRGMPFWRFFYGRLQEAFPAQLGGIELDRFYRAINRVHPSLVRIYADEVTYNLHIILRFELEQDIVGGRVELRDLPDEWNRRMHDYLGVEVPDDAHGVLQDTHWSGGAFGYFPTYALGNVVSLQLWEHVLADVPDLEEQFERGEFGALREWLRDRVHRHGRKFTPKETLARAIGTDALDSGPYLRYLREKHLG